MGDGLDDGLVVSFLLTMSSIIHASRRIGRRAARVFSRSALDFDRLTVMEQEKDFNRMTKIKLVEVMKCKNLIDRNGAPVTHPPRLQIQDCSLDLLGSAFALASGKYFDGFFFVTFKGVEKIKCDEMRWKSVLQILPRIVEITNKCKNKWVLPVKISIYDYIMWHIARRRCILTLWSLFFTRAATESVSSLRLLYLSVGAATGWTGLGPLTLFGPRGLSSGGTGTGMGDIFWLLAPMSQVKWDIWLELTLDNWLSNLSQQNVKPGLTDLPKLQCTTCTTYHHKLGRHGRLAWLTWNCFVYVSEMWTHHIADLT